MSVYEKLLAVQAELNAPKNQRNSFGNYNYRSAEDILEAVKPLLNVTKATITLTDDVVMIGERYYLKATATFTDVENGEHVYVNALANESGTHKGMSTEQITGTASSYARKYALNGLLLIDDNKDADTNEYKKQEQKAQQENVQAQDDNPSEWVEFQKKDGTEYCAIWWPASKKWFVINTWPNDKLLAIVGNSKYAKAKNFINRLIDSRNSGV